MASKSFIVKMSVAAAVVGAAIMPAFLPGGSASAQSATTPDRSAVLAQEQRIADCMASRGFTYQVAVPNDLVLDEAFQAAVAAGKTGADLEAAMTSARAALPPSPNEAVVLSMPASRQTAWNDAYSGTDAQPGCFEPGFAMSSAELERLEADSDRADSALAAARQSPDGQEALMLYHLCMQDLGHDVVDPDDFNAKLQEQTDSMRTDPESYPEEPPAGDAAASAAYAARMAAIAVKEARADQVQAAAEADNDQCEGWYDHYFDQAYDAAFAGS
jgi:hypothetical protein